MAIAETGVNSDRSIEQIPLGQVPTDLQPGSLPKKMRAWVIRRDREGEPRERPEREVVEAGQPVDLEARVGVIPRRGSP